MIKLVAAVIKIENKYLILKHNQINAWEFPVGKVDPGESATDAIIREMREELNITITEYKSYGNIHFIRNDNSYETSIFQVLKYTGKICNKEPQKHNDIFWANENDLLTLMGHKQIDKIIQAIIVNGKLKTFIDSSKLTQARNYTFKGNKQ